MGIPFVRIGDLNMGLIQKPVKTCISLETHQLERKTRLVYGDLAISKTAYPAAAMVNVDECNVSQDIIAVRLKSSAAQHFSPGFVAMYLNSKYGLTLMKRRFQGNVQQHLSLEDGKTVKIPWFDVELQERVHRLVQCADALMDESLTKYVRAEGVLLDACGLSDWIPSSPLSYVVRANDVITARRIDPAFFSPSYDELLAILKNNVGRLAVVQDFSSFNARGRQPEYVDEGDVFVVNSRHVLDNVIDYDQLETTTSDWLKTNSRCLLKLGDILTYSTGAYVGRTAHFSSTICAVASNHVNVLRIKEGDPAYVAFVLNSVIGRFQTSRYLSGSAQAELYAKDIGHCVIPFIAEDQQSLIAQLMFDFETLFNDARSKLRKAVRVVEIAIEHGVQAAMSEVGD